jgi:hypothetical protein
MLQNSIYSPQLKPDVTGKNALKTAGEQLELYIPLIGVDLAVIRDKRRETHVEAFTVSVLTRRGLARLKPDTRSCRYLIALLAP